LEPLFINKFGKIRKQYFLAWFWARIKKGLLSLAYPKGGFLEFAKDLQKQIEKRNGEVLFETEIIKLSENKKILLEYKR